MASIQVESIQPIGSQANPTRLAAYHQQTQPEFFFFCCRDEKKKSYYDSLSPFIGLYILAHWFWWYYDQLEESCSIIQQSALGWSRKILSSSCCLPWNRADALSITMKWPLRIHGVVNELYFNLQKMKAERPSFWLTDKRKPKSRLFSCYFLPY